MGSSPADGSRWRTPWALLTFLVGYCVLLAVTSHYYLLPALEAMRDATAAERQWLSASSALLLSVILFILCVGIVLAFRVSRFFFPREDVRNQIKTTYVDAWTESSRRLALPGEEGPGHEADGESNQ